MRENYVEAAQLAIYQELEKRPPNKGIVMMEYVHLIPDDITDPEFQAAIEPLQSQHFITVHENQRMPGKTLIVRGPSYPKWHNQLSGAQVNNNWNINNNNFDGNTAIGPDASINVQINESDSQQLIALIEKICTEPEKREEAASLLSTIKSAGQFSAKEALKQLLKVVIAG